MEFDAVVVMVDDVGRVPRVDAMKTTVVNVQGMIGEEDCKALDAITLRRLRAALTQRRFG